MIAARVVTRAYKKGLITVERKSDPETIDIPKGIILCRITSSFGYVNTKD